jgi:hypothetical protein
MKSHSELLKKGYTEKRIPYDNTYDYFEGWLAYAKTANTYKLRKKIVSEIQEDFLNEISSKEIDRMIK